MNQPAENKPDLSRLKIDRSRNRRASVWGKTPKVILVALLIAAAWWYWNKMKESGETEKVAPSGPSIVVVDYASGDGADGVSGNGYVIARRRAALSTVLAGRLVEIHVEEGTTVSEGQIVARIQYDDYESALEESRALLQTTQSRLAEIGLRKQAAQKRVEEAKSAVQVSAGQIKRTKIDLDQAKRDRERNRQSYLEKDVSEARWDELVTAVKRLEEQLKVDQLSVLRTKTSVKTADADVDAIDSEIATQKKEIERIQAQIRSAEILLDKTFIRAPFAGVIVDKGAEEGEVVAATGAGGNSRGSVATLVDLATLEVQVELPETRLEGIREKQICEIYLDVSPKKAWPGAVRQIWPTADRGKGTVEIRVTFEERPQVLRPEMGARVVFLNDDGSDANAPKKVLVPSAAIVKKNGKPMVWVVQNGVLSMRPVTTGGILGSKTEIESGLEAGEKIVNRPTSNLQVGKRFSGGN